MSEELKKENETLKAQLAQNTQGVQTLLAQLDAHRQTMNESLNASLQMRTNLVLFQKQAEQQAAKIAELTKELEELKTPKP